MIGLVLVSHGRLAEELRLALEHVVGPRSSVATVCIGPDDDMELRRRTSRQHRQVDDGDGVVLLTDMFGGTPSNLAISLMDRPGVEVIAGVNLPMLVKLAKVRAPPDARRVRGLRAGRRAQVHRRRVARAARLHGRQATARPTAPRLMDAPRPTRPSCARRHDLQPPRPACPRRRQVRHHRRAVHAPRWARPIPWPVRLGPIDHGPHDAGRRRRAPNIEMRAEGWDAKEALAALARLVEAGFNEQD